ncbi:hypothetical protein MMC28_010554 [Mycoblastus sanguinarius]|nr:hypothetical protein [Mycoblastus sanguinarius]
MSPTSQNYRALLLSYYTYLLTYMRSFITPPAPIPAGSVLAVSLSPTHSFSKPAQPSITLLKGLGVDGDAHCGTLDQHLYHQLRDRRANKSPSLNLRQVHLMPSELFEDIEAQSKDKGEGGVEGGGEGEKVEKVDPVQPGQLGENITTRGINLLALGRGTRLKFVGQGGKACPVVKVTGLRHPCKKIDEFRKGLKDKVLYKDGNKETKTVQRRAGVMGVVEVGGLVEPGMRVLVQPARVFEALGVV